MNRFCRLQRRQLAWWLLCLIAFVQHVGAGVISPLNQPVITSLTIAGTNLAFNATFPAGVDAAVLEMRSTLTDPWQPSASIDVPTNGGDLTFSIPLPPTPTAFFRLNATMQITSQAEVSPDVQYVAVPSLARLDTNGELPSEAVFHFKGQIDGSDRIIITHKGATWEHVNWDWPVGTVTVNDSVWNPSEKDFMTCTNVVAFLPENFSLASARLEVIQGRDVIALEQTNDAVVVYLDDTFSGAAPYEFNIHFYPATQSPDIYLPSPAATLKIAAQIDGSDRLKITAQQATWTHVSYSLPGSVTLNGVPWDIGQTNVLANSGTNTFLPAGLDFSTARITSRKGRDLATMWADRDALWVTFADNPNGLDDYELDISFGQ